LSQRWAGFFGRDIFLSFPLPPGGSRIPCGRSARQLGCRGRAFLVAPLLLVVPSSAMARRRGGRVSRWGSIFLPCGGIETCLLATGVVPQNAPLRGVDCRSRPETSIAQLSVRMAEMSVRMDSFDRRLDRIERRLDLVPG
jgi:hypothetical protein